jgi:hypothetical protein
MSTVAAVSDLTYVANYLEFADQEELLTRIDREVWRDDLRRRVQHYAVTTTTTSTVR